MATIVAVSAAGLFAWGTFVRLWRGDEADRVLNRASVSNLANTKFGTFGQFYDAAGLVGLAAPVLVVIVCCLVGIALQWWWIDTLLIVRQQQNTPWMP